MLTEGKSWDEARKLANDELADFYGLDENTKSFENNTMRTVSVKELLAENYWLSALNYSSYYNYPDFLYEAVKKMFARTGGFYEPMTVGEYDGYSIKRFFVDFLVMPFMESLESGNSPSDYFGPFGYEFIQKALARTYKLPDDASQRGNIPFISSVSDGYTVFFEPVSGLWIPVPSYKFFSSINDLKENINSMLTPCEKNIKGEISFPQEATDKQKEYIQNKLKDLQS